MNRVLALSERHYNLNDFEAIQGFIHMSLLQKFVFTFANVAFQFVKSFLKTLKSTIEMCSVQEISSNYII